MYVDCTNLEKKSPENKLLLGSYCVFVYLCNKFFFILYYRVGGMVYTIHTYMAIYILYI